jgi:hypothetical protein
VRSAGRRLEPTAIDLNLDSMAFARERNAAWKERSDLKGRVVVGFGVETRADVDALYADMIVASYRGLHAPQDMFWGTLRDHRGPRRHCVGVMSPVSPERRSPPPEV